MRARSVTIEDVAQLADVSIATVSRVINQPNIVNVATRGRVQSAIERLGYRPNMAASGLKSGSFRNVCFLVADISQPWYSMLTKAVEKLLDGRGFRLQLFDISHSHNRLLDFLSELPKLSVDGAILSTGDYLADAEVLRALEKLSTRLPLTVAAQRLDQLGIPSVVYDDRGGAFVATSHLLEGYGAPVAYLGLIPGSLIAAERYAGYKAAVEEAGEEPLQVDVFGFGPSAGLDAMRRLLASAQPSGLLAANDELALGAMRVLSEAKIEVPRDIGIVGFGDTTFAPYLTPSLSSVHGPVDDIAELVVGGLFSLLDGGKPKLLRSIPRELVVRESSIPGRRRNTVRREKDSALLVRSRRRPTRAQTLDTSATQG